MKNVKFCMIISTALAALSCAFAQENVVALPQQTTEAPEPAAPPEPSVSPPAASPAPDAPLVEPPTEDERPQSEPQPESIPEQPVQGDEKQDVPVRPAEEKPQAQPVPVEQQTQGAAEKDVTSAYRGIVKIEVANSMPDYCVPWRAGRFGRGNGTGFMVAPGVFMTNAHVVANAQRIYVSPHTGAQKIPARVKYVAHDADLALVEIDDKSAFEDVPYLEFSDALPHLEDEVRAVGYPIGGNRLSVTRGIISRIDTIPYAHPQNDSHLIVQIDAAINPGNSGGPVLLGDKVVGVAFQGLRMANSTGYMIPIPVIRHFLQDVEDGRYDHYVEIGATFFATDNPAMRRRLGLKNDGMGAVVGEVARGSSSDGQLEVGDVVLAVNGYPVDGSAMIELDGERVKLEEIAERSFSGDVLSFSILRDGVRKEVKVKLQPFRAMDITGNVYDELPRYVHFAGLIFQPLQRNVAVENHLNSPGMITEMDDFIRGGGSTKKEDIVVLTDVLSDEVNARFTHYGSRIVTKVNGQEVKGLSHLFSLLYPENDGERPEYVVIEFKDAARPFVVETAALKAAHARIMAGYNIPEPARLK